MDASQADKKLKVDADVNAVMAKNARLSREIKLALESEAVQVAAAAELKAQIFDMNQQRQRYLDQVAAREDALAFAAVREEDLRKQLIRAEREATEMRDEIFTLATALLDFQRKADEVPALVQKLRILETQVTELKASTSWRVTMPLRKLKDGLRFLMGT
jgi:chromosome segregation ATPase